MDKTYLSNLRAKRMENNRLAAEEQSKVDNFLVPKIIKELEEVLEKKDISYYDDSRLSFNGLKRVAKYFRDKGLQVKFSNVCKYINISLPTPFEEFMIRLFNRC